MDTPSSRGGVNGSGLSDILDMETKREQGEIQGLVELVDLGLRQGQGQMSSQGPGKRALELGTGPGVAAIILAAVSLTAVEIELCMEANFNIWRAGTVITLLTVPSAPNLTLLSIHADQVHLSTHTPFHQPSCWRPGYPVLPAAFPWPLSLW